VNDSFLSAFLLSAPVSSFSGRPLTLLGERVKSAVVRLMALAHASISVEFVLRGVRAFMSTL
jgi:small neutral amino acid transporter SnatA (MarC family)